MRSKRRICGAGGVELLLPASRAYILYQVFDYVHRCPEPVRFLKLHEDIEDIEAWPGFREYVINDPRFLVVGDTIDIATAGIHSSASTEDIISQTLDLLYVPMTDYTLNRLVKRLRPDTTESDPTSRAFHEGGFFRPEIKHLARIKWLSRGKVLPVRPEWLVSPDGAAYTLIEKTKIEVSAADLSITLAEYFGIASTDAYSLLVQNNKFLLLPDGNICLYDQVMDNIENHKSSKNPGLNEMNESAVGLPEEIIEFEIPENLDVLVVELCRLSGKPVSTERILELLKIKTNDPVYVSVFSKVTSFLGYSAEILPVGSNLWFAVDAIPAEVFFRVKQQVQLHHTYIHTSDPIEKPDLRIQLGPVDRVSLIVKEFDLLSGCLSGGPLNEIFPDYPMIQMYEWSGLDSAVWYNTETRTMYGLHNWLFEHKVEPGDSVKMTLRSGKITAAVHKETTGFTGKHFYPKETFSVGKRKSLFTYVTDHLAAAGGRLEKSKLIELLQKEDVSINWSVIAPLFERYPLLRCDEQWCWIAERPGKTRSRTVADSEVLEIIQDVPEHIRTNSEILDLIHLSASQERVTVTEEKLLIAKARNGSKKASDNLVLSHLRQVVRYLLQRSDSDLLLSEFSDYFQEGVIGLMKAVRKFNPSRAKHLHQATGWYIKSAIDRARLRLSLIRFPDHFYYQIEKYRKQRSESIIEGSEVQDGDANESFGSDVQYWSDFEWTEWVQALEEYEDGKIKPVWLGLSDQAENSENVVIDRIVVQELLNLYLLSEREADVVCRSYGLNNVEETYEQISEDYGITRSRIQQIHAKALSKLQKALKQQLEFS